MALVLGWLVVFQVIESVREDRLREPARAAQFAAARQGERIPTVPHRVADRWAEGDGPSESEVRALHGSAGRLLEAPYIALHGGLGGPASPLGSARCYYVGIQDQRGEFDADEASGLLRTCYRGPDADPWSIGSVSLSG